MNAWSYCGLYAFGAAASAAGFTLLWSITYYQVTALLGIRTRKDLTTQNIIGTGVWPRSRLWLTCASWQLLLPLQIAVLGMLPDELAFGGFAATAVMSIIWAVSDYVFVERLVNNSR